MEIYELKQWLEEKNTKIETLSNLLQIDALKHRISALEKETYAPDFWDNQTLAKRVIDTLKFLKNQCQTYEDIKSQYDTLEVALELLEMEEPVESLETDMALLEETLERFEVALFLSEEYDQLNAIIEIHPGAGGTESQDWAEMLFRMYKRYAEKKQFEWTLNDYQDGNEAGLKSATFTISGSHAYGFLKAESGVHRLVRLSPFDSSGRRHTSFASVNVVPEIDDTINIEIDESDLKIDTYRSSGAGGQSVNTTDSAVRITHLPTKLVVTCQNERSQIKNRDKALQILKGKLYQLEIDRQKSQLDDMRNISQSNAFGSQIRSYVMHPYAMVKDHRTSIETAAVQKVLDGDIDDFIHGYLKAQAKKESA